MHASTCLPHAPHSPPTSRRCPSFGRRAASVNTGRAVTDRASWSRLQPRWEAWADDSRALAQQLSLQGGMSPAWRLLLLSDGSLTRHLQLLTDASDVEVQLVSHARLDAPDFSALLPQCGVLTPPLVQRQVCLRPVGAAGELQSQEALVYACSWWNERDFEASMGARPGVPIWRNLSAQRAECFREHAGLVLGDPPPGGDAGLSAAFGIEGPFWGRWYTLWRGGAALTVIYEVFSPKLGVWCGTNDGRD